MRDDERLRSAADAAAAWEVIPRPRAQGTFQRRAQAARAALAQLEVELARQSVARRCRAIRNWRRDAPRCSNLARAIACSGPPISASPTGRAKWPGCLVSFSVRGRTSRVWPLSPAPTRRRRWNFLGSHLPRLYAALQAHEPLNVDELWSVGAFLKFALLEIILDEARELLRFPGSIVRPSAAGPHQESAIHQQRRLALSHRAAHCLRRVPAPGPGGHI